MYLKLKPGNSFSYTCSSDEVLESYTNTISVTADPVDDNLDEVTDNDDSKIIIEPIKECTKLEVNPDLLVV